MTHNTRLGIIAPLPWHSDVTGKSAAFLQQTLHDPRIIDSLFDHDSGANKLKYYHVLAIVHRDFDYQKDHEATKRILAAYHSLGITTIH